MSRLQRNKFKRGNCMHSEFIFDVTVLNRDIDDKSRVSLHFLWCLRRDFSSVTIMIIVM